jgi:hypothetical protein
MSSQWIGAGLSALGLIGNLFGNSSGSSMFMDLHDSKELMKYQSKQYQKNTQWLNENGYSQLRKGLESANYNPLLAVGATPQQGAMPNAVAQRSNSWSFNKAAQDTANVAMRQSDAQIDNLKANTANTYAQANTEAYKQENLASNTRLQTMQTIAMDKKLPYEIRQLATETMKNEIMAQNIQTQTAYIPYNARTNRISANANKHNAENKGYTTSIGLGPLKFSHTGKPIKSHIEYEYINGKKVPVTVYD